MRRLHQVIAATILCCASATANAVIIDFINMADGAFGESAWNPLTLSFAGFSVDITATATAPTDDDNSQYAYLDTRNNKGPAGLGVCKDLINDPGDAGGPNPGSSTNVCSPSSDDNVTFGESLHFVFTEDVVIDNLWFNNNHDGGFNPLVDLIDIQGAPTSVDTGYAGGPNGIGPFPVLNAGSMFDVRFNNQQFYISAMEVRGVPEPGTLALLVAGLLGLSIMRRQRTTQTTAADPSGLQKTRCRGGFLWSRVSSVNSAKSS